MKTMSCKQLGGPCEAEFNGRSANDVIKAQDRHLKDMVAAGDETHRDANKAMRDRWKHPIAGMSWYRETKQTFASLPESTPAPVNRH